MQTNVTQTSLFAYSIVKDGSEPTQCETVKFFMNMGHKTANALGRVTGMHPSKVSARLNKLKEKGEVYKTGNKVIDPVTGLPNEEWDFVKKETI